jgi:hypothetical protein
MPVVAQVGEKAEEDWFKLKAKLEENDAFS